MKFLDSVVKVTIVFKVKELLLNPEELYVKMKTNS